MKLKIIIFASLSVFFFINGFLKTDIFAFLASFSGELGNLAKIVSLYLSLSFFYAAIYYGHKQDGDNGNKKSSADRTKKIRKALNIFIIIFGSMFALAYLNLLVKIGVFSEAVADPRALARSMPDIIIFYALIISSLILITIIPIRLKKFPP